MPDHSDPDPSGRGPGSNPGVPFIVEATTQILAPVQNTTRGWAPRPLQSTKMQDQDQLRAGARYEFSNLLLVSPGEKASKMRRRCTQSKQSSTKNTLVQESLARFSCGWSDRVLA